MHCKHKVYLKYLMHAMNAKNVCIVTYKLIIPDNTGQLKVNRDI